MSPYRRPAPRAPDRDPDLRELTRRLDCSVRVGVGVAVLTLGNALAHAGLVMFGLGLTFAGTVTCCYQAGRYWRGR